jgi:hypothetical protein
MKRWLTLGLIFAAAPWIVAQEGAAWLPEPFDLGPFGRFQAGIMGTAGRESRAVAIGSNGRTPLGIYVYDPQGHCVALDDEPGPYIDDRIAAWMPAVSGAFDVQVRNMGPGFNRVEASAK